MLGYIYVACLHRADNVTFCRKINNSEKYMKVNLFSFCYTIQAYGKFLNIKRIHIKSQGF
ncbi:hypothetical protein NLO413_0877 [Candidatus Neoehrlichia lotoris str. RAC413]|uniref:Uncharacterized protein n=1 Tax=Candidatus Neoehrlichia procyonis str. RAC413 TaxID=1359163 RepID=A0A0F3NRE8_9RICK|nr:hypothetical protein NLO413_0877 [Candidatus Neoehrlichia lotoris str. RAC413]